MTAKPFKVLTTGTNYPEALPLLAHLTATYPLPYKLIVNFIRREGLLWGGIACIMGKARFVDHCVPGAKRFELRVCIGKKSSPRPHIQILKTLCHEYKHAIQYATNATVDCNEADRFALNELSLYLTRTTGVPYAIPFSLVPNFVPPISHLRKVLHHLAVNYSLYKAVHIDYVRRCAPKTPGTGCRNLRDFKIDEPFGFRVAIGIAAKPRPGADVIHATLHGYQHVIQQSKGKPLDCDEADKFALKILNEVGVYLPEKEGSHG